MAFNCSVRLNESDKELVLFQGVAYTFVFAIGLPLIILTLWFFTRIHRWTDTHVYMFNLMFADFILILFLPFRIFETFCLINPSNFCTFLICVHYSNMYVSIFTITAISAHRFMAIRFPLRAKGLEARRKTVACIVCVLIWVTVITICISFRKNLLPEKLEKCFERKSSNPLSKEFLLVLEIIGYLLPIIIITTCSTQAVYTIRKSTDACLQKTDALERKRVAAIITANMIIFIVCFTPVHIGYLMRFFSKHERFSHIFYDVSEWIATTNCCLDTVGYYFLLKKVFRYKM